ncbi:MAG TPA: putative lipid II flippase FtsW [Ruminococcaceae bacterium]|nr:putative lipid II flippase FtsW [Oscillospiraceae bacterium]
MLVLLLLTMGLVMLFSASYAIAYYEENNSFYYITRQGIFAIAGIVAMFVISTIDYRIFQKFANLILLITIFLLIVVLFMPKINGVRRWIIIAGFFNFQPSEIAKFAVAVWSSAYIAKNYDNMKKFKVGILPFLIVFGIIAGLMVLEPHFSGTILILAIGAVLMVIGGSDLKWFGLAATGGAAALGAAMLIPSISEYAIVRIKRWLDPFQDYYGSGFQTIQSLYAIGSGGLLGTGIGNSRQKYLYLPEPQNDFIFAVVCEELGFIGAVLIILLFVLLVWRGYVISIKARDKFATLLGIGLTTQVGLQALLNIAVVTNTIPNTGISLPFFSSGGTSLLMLLAQMGIVLSISRTSSAEKP